MSDPVDPPRLRSDSALGRMVGDARAERLEGEARERIFRSIEMATAGAGAGSGLRGKLRALSLSKIGVVSLVVLLGAVPAAMRWRARTAEPRALSAAPVLPTVEATSPVLAAPPVADPAAEPLPSAIAPPAPSAPAVSPLPAVRSAPRIAPVADEGSLLLEAKAALASDPRKTLALAAEHERTFPASALGAERESIVIDALARLGRCAEVRARAERFRTVYRSGVYRGLVERLEAGCSG